jgi:hypothetical protein
VQLLNPARKPLTTQLEVGADAPPSALPVRRRLRDRFSFGKLFVEFLIVFAGVTLSLLAEDWRDGRRVDATANQALRLILADLRSDSARLAVVLEPLPAQDQAAEWLTRHWTDQSTPVDSVESRLMAFLPAWPYQPQRTAFISLRDGAGMGVIGNDDLRQAIVRYFEETQVEVQQWVDFHWSEREVLWEILWPHVRMPPGKNSGSMLPSNGDPPKLLTAWPTLIAKADGYNQIGQVGVSANLAVVALREALAANGRLREAVSSYVD